MQTPDSVEDSKLISFDSFLEIKRWGSRVDPTLFLATDRKTLNVGCCGSDILIMQNSVHSKLASVSRSCLGVDIFEEGIKQLSSQGFDVRYMSAENLTGIDNDFEVIVMSEIIEHLANPGLSLDSAYKHAGFGAKIIVSTPNPFSLRVMIRRIIRGNSAINTDHVAWFDPILLRFLMERSGWKVNTLYWCGSSKYKIINLIFKLRGDLSPEFALIGEKFNNQSKLLS